jgi:hypothetical protein
VLEPAPSGYDVRLVEAFHFLAIVNIVVSHDCNPLRVLLSPLLATLGILPSALDDGARWCRSSATRDHFPATWDRKRSARLFIGGILGGDVEQ